MPQKPLRTVTRGCAVCRKKFKPARRDSRYCSDACRQKAHRARASVDDADRRLEQARLAYWALYVEIALARGLNPSCLATQCSQYVDVDGNVYEGWPGAGGRIVGRTKPKAGWHTWGLEAAGPPWTPPPVEPSESPRPPSGDGRKQ